MVKKPKGSRPMKANKKTIGYVVYGKYPRTKKREAMHEYYCRKCDFTCKSSINLFKHALKHKR